LAINVIESKQAEELAAAGNAIIIDVREPAEHSACHILNSHLLSLSKINGEQINKLVEEHKNLTGSEPQIVLHCQKGMRGLKACEKLISENPSLHLHNLNGGIDAWTTAGLQVNKSSKGVLPLDRQVQITIGSVVLIASLLSYFYNPNVIFVSAFFGAGLLFAGLSGFCGLARVVAIMPWNQRTS
jgi:rhodanese-related sulfurtransferase